MGNIMSGPSADALGLSQALWSNIPLEMLLGGKNADLGIAMFDNFLSFGGALSTNDGTYHSEGNNYLSYQTASTFIAPVALTPTPASVAPTSYGAVKFSPTTGVADNDIMTLQWGGQLATPYGSYPFAVVPGVSGDLVFECRLKLSDSSASIGDFFIGLGGAGGTQLMTAVLPIADADTLTTTHSLLGFSKLGTEADGAYLTHQRSGGTVARANKVAALVDNTYIKLGFRWDSATQVLTPYVDGVPVDDYKVLAGTGTGRTGATPWPNNYMAPVCCCHQIDGTTAQELTLDWWGCAQMRL
jgi:hypothetical protein